MRQKRGQLTLFIILGVVILTSILIAIYLYNPDFFSISPPKIQADTFEYCVKSGTDEIIKQLAPTAGFTGSYFNKTYQGVAVPYVCYTEEYYKPCVVQVPFLEENFKESFLGLAEETVQSCYNDYIEDFQRKGYEVSSGDVEIVIDLQKDKMKIDILAPASISDGDSTSTLEDFSFEIPTEIYNILMLANNIIKYETTYGEYELVNSQLLYPDLPVNAFKLGDGTIIYVINSGETKYQFAIRSYVFPPGY